MKTVVTPVTVALACWNIMSHQILPMNEFWARAKEMARVRRDEFHIISINLKLFHSIIVNADMFIQENFPQI